VIDPDKLDVWQSVLLSGFSLLFLAMLVASIVLHIWVWNHWKWLLAWTGWNLERPKAESGQQGGAWVGLIDLVLLMGCMIFVQSLMVSAVVVIYGVPMRMDSRVAPADAAVVVWPDLVQGLASTSGLQESVIQESTAIDESRIVDEANPSDPNSEATPSEKPNKLPTWLTPILGVALLLGGVLSAFLVVFRTGATPIQLGYWSTRFVGDVWVGLLVFLWATPIVLIQSQLVARFTEVEYQHPVIDAMADHPWMYPFLFLGAVVCAPLWEEYAFRALLIGWFNTLRRSGGVVRTILFGQREGDREAADRPHSTSASMGETTVGALGAGSRMSPAPGWVVADGSQDQAKMDSDGETREASGAGYPPWWPAILSGLVFGLAHWGYGVSWVPLITLGVILGRLFQLRQSLVPCIVVHGLFNSMSMMGLAVEVFVRRG
jgi:membrane protease YdiL (CAAX protease family)